MNRGKLRYIIFIPVVIVLIVLMLNKCSGGKEKLKEDTPEKVNNLLELSVEEQKDFAKTLTKSIVKNDFSNILSKTYLLDSTCYYGLTDYARRFLESRGNMSELVVDYVDVENSSTKDNVIMCNAKVWYEDASYNLVYTFEYHINSEGFIYGYNIWVH